MRDGAATGGRSREGGWTMIELVVAMVLLTIAFGMVASGVLRAFNGAASGRAGAISDAAISRASTLMGDDIAKAETQGRSEGLLRDATELATAVRAGGNPISSDPGTPGTVDIDDIVVATPRILQLRADVVLGGGVECVQWEATTTGGKYQLIRSVSATCGAAPTQRQVILDAPADAAGVVTEPFSYELVCNRSLCAGSKAAHATPCRPWPEDTVRGTQRRWIVGVRASLSDVSVEGRSAGRALGVTEMTVRSRDTEFWRAALGC